MLTIHFKIYCTEAMKAIIDFVHKEPGVNKICSDHAADNPRSGKVMEKCGLKFDHYRVFPYARNLYFRSVNI